MITQERKKSSQARPSVSKAVTAWKDRQDALAGRGADRIAYPPSESVLQSIPRRQQSVPLEERKRWIPYVEPILIKNTFGQSLRRLFGWLRVAVVIRLGDFFDQIFIRRNLIERRAVRFRRTLERAGGTFVKLGQQMAMRIDLLPWAYCVELSKMLDRMVPFPIEEALAAVERTIQRPWQEVFDVFDPKPIGSASLACVYQATLKDGTKVAVKVRRPGVKELFMADLQVLDWLSTAAEFLTIIRPGFTQNFRIELREILMEELDFRREGRFGDIFRRNVKKAGWKFFTAPKVYFEYSGDEVLVQEFASGLWLWEVIAILEQKDAAGLAMLKSLNIDPTVVARRILLANFWSADEHIFFHADPHPANILIRENNQLTFIDFGSCGSFNNQQRTALEQVVVSMKNQDVDAMTRAALNLMEPLPPVDVPSLVKHLQAEYMRMLHTFSTPAEYTQYWERTSARQWFVLMRVAQNFNIPMNLHMLRMIRATLLYDSIVMRLDSKLDRYDEYTNFMKIRAQFVKGRWRKKLRTAAGDGVFMSIEDVGNSFNDLMIRAQTILNKPLVNLGSTVNKWVFIASVLSRMAGRILFVSLLFIGLFSFLMLLSGQPVSFIGALSQVIQNKIYQLFLIVAVLFNTRLILFRLRDRDPAGTS
jgi:ubiquinone biosynthesis protein